jgi:rubrerythrin
MISTGTISIRWLVRAAAPLVWRSEARIARKLEGFAATEAGSALDMLKAAELTTDPRLCRLFFRHAMDEARHALLFREAARRIDPEARISTYQLIHAQRQNLFQKLGLVDFLAFVHLAERRGEAQFRALQRHFAAREDLSSLFARIAKDEQFHVAYSARLLRELQRAGRAKEVARALRRVQWTRLRDGWLRAGRILGDAVARVLLSLVYLVALPMFALAQKVSDPERTGWKRPPRRLPQSEALDAARRQF